ncbi:hypothetical protein DID80_07405 [Candidatus Marinamargulisbacteria bacterium SCGC AAA071-K20]|nr:hypothetical protein DID80_07405 [Candidatus Marinamargulisbacteria bacterium SCGC AAA071-K20]
MKKHFISFCLILLLISGYSYSSSTKGEITNIYFGTNSESGATILTNFSLEHYENNVRSKRQIELWFLNGSYIDNNFHLNLERQLFVDWGAIGTVVTSHKHSTFENTLVINKLDFEKGILDMKVIFPDKQALNTVIKFSKNKNSFYLTKFEGVTIAKSIYDSKLTPIVFKIPEYSYDKNITIQMTGMKSKEDKLLDDVENRLSKSDKKKFNLFIASLGDIFSNEFEAKIHSDLEKQILNYKEKFKTNAFSKEDNTIISEYYIMHATEKIKHLKFSKQGNIIVNEFIKTLFSRK